MSYSLDAIRKKLQQMSGADKAATKDAKKLGPKINWYKPDMGVHEIRFLPGLGEDGQAFLNIMFYNSKRLTERRIVAPYQYNMEDPILDALTELQKDKSKEAWMVWNNLKPTETFYAAIVDRNDPEQKVQIWELSQKLVIKIYTILNSKDYVDENLFDVKNGYDFTVSVTPTEKTYNGKPVKEINFQARRKSSPLADSEEKIKSLLDSIPDMKSYFKRSVMDTDKIENILTNFLTGNAPEGSEVASEEQKLQNSVEGSEKTSPSSAKSKKVKDSIDAAFDDL